MAARVECYVQEHPTGCWLTPGCCVILDGWDRYRLLDLPNLWNSRRWEEFDTVFLVAVFLLHSSHPGGAIYFHLSWLNETFSVVIDHPVRSIVALFLDSLSVCTFQWRFPDWYYLDPVSFSEVGDRFITSWEMSQMSHSVSSDPWHHDSLRTEVLTYRTGPLPSHQGQPA